MRESSFCMRLCISCSSFCWTRKTLDTRKSEVVIDSSVESSTTATDILEASGPESERSRCFRASERPQALAAL